MLEIVGVVVVVVVVVVVELDIIGELTVDDTGNVVVRARVLGAPVVVGVALQRPPSTKSEIQ